MIGEKPLGNLVYFCVWRSVLLVVHELLQDKEKDLGNVFQESELLIFCHWRCGNLFQCTPSLCIGILRISVVSCPTATSELAHRKTVYGVERGGSA